MPWSMIRDVAARIYTRADQHLQSAAVVGPAAPVYGFTDEENQAAFATSGRGGIQGPKRPGVETDVAIEPGPAVQIIERQQVSIFTFMKIVSANTSELIWLTLPPFRNNSACIPTLYMLLRNWA